MQSSRIPSDFQICNHSHDHKLQVFSNVLEILVNVVIIRPERRPVSRRLRRVSPIRLLLRSYDEWKPWVVITTNTCSRCSCTNRISYFETCVRRWSLHNVMRLLLIDVVLSKIRINITIYSFVVCETIEIIEIFIFIYFFRDDNVRPTNAIVRYIRDWRRIIAVCFVL